MLLDPGACLQITLTLFIFSPKILTWHGREIAPAGPVKNALRDPTTRDIMDGSGKLSPFLNKKVGITRSYWLGPDSRFPDSP